MALRRQGGKSAATAQPEVAIPPLEFDSTFGEPWRVAARERFASGDWRQLDELAGHAGDDLDHQQAIVDMADVDHEPVLRSWLAERPDSLVAACALGWCLTSSAWSVRGSGRANTVSASQFDEFFEILRRADATLVNAALAHPRSALPWTVMHACSMGLQIPLEEAKDRYARGEELGGINCWNVRAMLQVVAQKWSGSHDEMFQFARGVSSRAPDGHPAHSVIALAYIEYVLDDDTRAGDQPLHRHEVRQALDRSRLLDPTWRLDREGFAARNDFAYIFARYGDRPTAAALLQILGWDGRRLSRSPWNYTNRNAAKAIYLMGRACGAWQ